MKVNQLVYRSFLVRFWHEKSIRNKTLRVIVVDIQTYERYGFDSFDGLVQFLNQRIMEQETKRPDQEVVIDDTD